MEFILTFILYFAILMVLKYAAEMVYDIYTITKPNYTWKDLMIFFTSLSYIFTIITRGFNLF